MGKKFKQQRQIYKDKISSLRPDTKWGYFKPKENLADIGSREISSEKLKDCNMWWHGSNWLNKEKQFCPVEETSCNFTGFADAPQQDYFQEIVNKFSSFRKAKCIFAYMLRFMEKTKGERNLPNFLPTKKLNAEMIIVKCHEQAEMSNELNIRRIWCNRVGDRLQYSSLSYNTKHQVILYKSHLADLIKRNIHQTTLYRSIRLMEIVFVGISGLKYSIRNACTNVLNVSGTKVASKIN